MQHIPFHLFTIPVGCFTDVFTAAALLFGAGFAVLLVGTRDRAASYARLAEGESTLCRRPGWSWAGCAALPMVLPVLGGQERWSLPRASVFWQLRVFGLPSARRIGGGALVLCALALFLAPFADQVLPITVSSKRHPLLPRHPGHRRSIQRGTGCRASMSTRLTAAPTLGWPAPGLSIVIDGGSAATGIGDLSAGVEHWLSRADYQPPGLAYVGKERPKVLILGSGAGPRGARGALLRGFIRYRGRDESHHHRHRFPQNA